MEYKENEFIDFYDHEKNIQKKNFCLNYWKLLQIAFKIQFIR